MLPQCYFRFYLWFQQMKFTLPAVAGVSVLSSFPAISNEVSFDGELRERVTYLSALEFDEESEEAGLFWTQRIIIGSNFEMTESWSFRGAIFSALQEGVASSPIERNNLDVYEAFVQYQNSTINFRLGRQTLKLGSQRLIGWRDGTNVRRSWDGFRVGVEHNSRWQSDWFALQLVEVEHNGVFNDDTSSENLLAGSYFTGDLTALDVVHTKHAQLELYYLYTNRKQRNAIEGTADQLRHTLGVRLSGDATRWFWDWEAAQQMGRHGTDDIRAWTIATNTGVRIDGMWAPEVMLSVNIASGDDTRDDGRLETFDALYPRGSYFSESAQLGPANFYNFHPYIYLYPSETIRLQFDVNFYWRLERNDGVYGPPGNIIQLPNDNLDKKVNVAFSAGFEWEINEATNISLLATYSDPKGILAASDNHADSVKFVEFTVNWAFF